MKRFLLFDSDCSVCNTLAQAIEEEANGWLQAASLHEPSMQHILSQTIPDWSWEPMLLEITTRKTRVFTGLSMRARLVKGVGLKRACRMAQLMYQTNMDKYHIDQGRRQFLHRSSALLAALPLLGMSMFEKDHRTYVTGWKRYKDQDFGFGLDYPSGWQVEFKEEQPTPMVDDEAILKRVIFSSSPALVYLDIWLAKGKDLADWLAWYKETRLVEQMLTKENATVAKQPASTFLQNHQRDLMLTYFSDGMYIYRLLNWMTGDPLSLDVYWHMLDTFSLPRMSTLTMAEIPISIKGEAERSSHQLSWRMVNCCGYSDPGNPFPCCGDGNCTWWAYRQMGWVPFTGDAKTWWGQVPNHAGWTRNSYPSTNISSIGWHNRGEYGHVAYIANYLGGSQVNITDMTCSDDWSCVRTTSKSLSYFGGYIYPLWV
ncbi:hypothetical protein MNBD_CHLOROFLEXI01-1109 [hydrothermal vent metagenome]|uniref:Peptidase C51 domain-containing protein n=1 Tax=hydrothermal vent metagenome TaxID=652676 RepID=A0A3B0VHJ9_9ZZZZ